MNVVTFRLGAFCVPIIAALGCAEAEGDGIARQAVSGTVTLGGRPLGSASIEFVPSDPAAGGGAAGEVKDGEFRIEGARGPAPGTYRVNISSFTDDAGASPDAPPGPAPKPKPRKTPAIPRRYNVESTLNAEVKADGPNTFSFDLEPK